MKQRGQFWNLLVDLDETVTPIYINEHDNVQVKMYFMQQFESKDSKDFDKKMKMIEPVAREEKKKLLQLVTKDMILQKFTGRSQNTDVWLQTLNMECDQLEIEENRCPEVMRLFLEKSLLEWFNSAWTIYREENWNVWMANFTECFSDKGWNEVWSAVNFKWLQGSLYSEYIIRENSLLLDALPNLNEKCCVALIIIGIPQFVWGKN